MQTARCGPFVQNQPTRLRAGLVWRTARSIRRVLWRMPCRGESVCAVAHQCLVPQCQVTLGLRRRPLAARKHADTAPGTCAQEPNTGNMARSNFHLPPRFISGTQQLTCEMSYHRRERVSGLHRVSADGGRAAGDSASACPSIRDLSNTLLSATNLSNKNRQHPQ
jgi:hypothetical protein